MYMYIQLHYQWVDIIQNQYIRRPQVYVPESAVFILQKKIDVAYFMHAAIA